jgi:hypothetical protein
LVVRRLGPRGSVAIALAAYAVVAVLLFAGAWRAPLVRNVGGGGDMPIFAWGLRWAPWAVAHLHNPLVTNHIDFPAGANLMWNTTMLLPALLLAPVTLLGGPLLSYNFLATAGVVLPAWVAYIALRRLTRTRAAAWVGGLAWGFGPWVLAQTRGDHLHLTVGVVALPLLTLAAHEAFVVQRRSAVGLGALLGAGAGLWILVGEEALLVASVSVAVGLAALALCQRGWWRAGGRTRMRYAGVVMAWALGVFVVIAAIPVGWQVLGPQRIDGPIFSSDAYSADLLAAIVPPGHQLVHTSGSADQSRRFASEEGSYLGLPIVLAAAAVALRHRRRATARAIALTASVLWLLSLGPHLRVGGHATAVPLPWDLVPRLPLFDDLLPVRLAAGVGFAVAALLAIGIDDLLSIGTASPSAVGIDHLCAPGAGVEAAGAETQPAMGADVHTMIGADVQRAMGADAQRAKGGDVERTAGADRQRAMGADRTRAIGADVVGAVGTDTERAIGSDDLLAVGIGDRSIVEGAGAPPSGRERQRGREREPGRSTASAPDLPLGIERPTALAASGQRPRPAMLLAVAAVVVGVTTLAPSLPFRSNRPLLPAYFTSSDVQRIPADSLVVIAPSPGPDRPFVELWQAAAGLRFRIDGGYMLVPDAHGHASFAAAPSPTAVVVTGIEAGDIAVNGASVATVGADLRHRKVSTVIVGPMAHGDDVVRLFTRVLASPPRRTGGVAVWERVDQHPA